MNGAGPGPLTTPLTPAARMSERLRHFLHLESATGVVLLACTALALGLANSPWAQAFASFWAAPLTIGVGSFELAYPLWYWVNDGLMALFFFVIGLEIKRETVSGELSDRRAIVLPLLGALGGAAVPALVFLVVHGPGEGLRAWAVPTATDIAFVVGTLALLGARVPVGLKVFLLSLAIFDDLFAVVVIALFYSGTLGLGWLAAAAAALGAVLLLQRLGVRRVGIYTVAGVALWFFTLKSGVHPTIAGVLLGLLTPARPWLSDRHLRREASQARRQLKRGTPTQRREALLALRETASETIAPSERLETALHPWVAFVVMPIFALANAGVPVRVEMLGSPLAIAVALGLVVGKLVGITLGAWAAVRLGWSVLPRGVGWPALASGACLAGIGFTMSMFIASLALTGSDLTAAKSGVLLGSLVAGVIGFVALRATLPLPGPAAAGGGGEAGGAPASAAP